MEVTIIVPTLNEAANVDPLVRRVHAVIDGLDAEVIFVDDSTDGTAAEIERVARSTGLKVRVIHRENRTGGLGGAVLVGLRAAVSDVCIVMDGDLQHPPEVIPLLIARFQEGDADVVIASRYAGGGDSGGLASAGRGVVSRAATALTKAMFPIRLWGCTDPMTGYFLVDRTRIPLDELRPIGFKILLEILARSDARAVEIPFSFADRATGDSKASLRQGFHFVAQLTRLRFGKMSLFAIIGAFGAVVNLLIMWVLTRAGMDYIWAAIVAAEITIVGNFLLQERFVFADMRERASTVWVRFGKSFTFNNAEAAIRIPILAFMVENWHVSSVLAAAITLVFAFLVRFLFHSLVVYAPRRPGAAPSRTRRLVEQIDAEAMRPGEL